MERAILHMDDNSFYASAEQQRWLEHRNRPVAVVGNPEARHGIILTDSFTMNLGKSHKSGKSAI